MLVGFQISWKAIKVDDKNRMNYNLQQNYLDLRGSNSWPTKQMHCIQVFNVQEEGIVNQVFLQKRGIINEENLVREICILDFMFEMEIPVSIFFMYQRKALSARVFYKKWLSSMKKGILAPLFLFERQVLCARGRHCQIGFSIKKKKRVFINGKKAFFPFYVRTLDFMYQRETLLARLFYK